MDNNQGQQVSWIEKDHFPEEKRVLPSSNSKSEG